MTFETTDTTRLLTYPLGNNSGVNMDTRTRAGGPLKRLLAAATLKAIGITCVIAGLALATAFVPAVELLIAVASLAATVWAVPRIRRASDEQLRYAVPAACLFLLVAVGLAVGAVLMSEGLMPAPTWSAFD